ncbi:hypothetical protein [Geobacillus stearothermophilus]|uniref:hypothetical protein n=1 Tax=Geobacillus stearothermophilus TaxID=1422 RepID=UPI00240270BC|nr:hypothetical protein [Geobacillus stearothermophilus]MDF9296103.1 hypothetical protein [Geobacillus stearothermophilus]
MAYIDYDFYANVYKGSPISDANTFDRLAMRASEWIDEMTSGQITDLSVEPEWRQTLLKKAVAAQVEYLYQNGEGVLQGVTDLQDVKIGDFSYKSASPGNPTSPLALSFLRRTGWLYAGVESHD